jgi:cell division protein FtsB
MKQEIAVCGPPVTRVKGVAMVKMDDYFELREKFGKLQKENEKLKKQIETLEHGT